MPALRHDLAARRQRLDARVSKLKLRFGIASVFGFGAIFGLVTQHAVGSQKPQKVARTDTRTVASTATTFFDANGPGYSFDDSAYRAARQSNLSQSSQGAQASGSAQPPVAQSSAS